MNKEYSIDLQKLFLEMMLNDAQNFVRVQNIFNKDNFDRSLRDTAEFIQQHSTDHSTLLMIYICSVCMPMVLHLIL